jgi:hypothetical protein
LPNRFRSRPTRSHRVSRRTPIDSDSGGTQIETVTTTRNKRQRTIERRTPVSTGGSEIETTSETESGGNSRRPLRQYSPTRVGDKASGVGLLEAEFLGSLLLLILLLFADTDKSYADKIMSTMKRGTMICILFFVLALMAGIGPGSAKISKAIGAMVFVAILVTSPVLNMFGNLDKFFKADWTATGEHGTDVGATSSTSDSGSTATGGSAGPLQAAEGAINRITQIINSFGFGLIK